MTRGRFIVAAVLIWLLCLPGPAATVAQDEGQDIGALYQAFDNSNPDVRRKAANEIGKQGIQAAPAVPSLIEALGDEDRSVQKAAVRALGCVGKPAVPKLIKALDDARPTVREGCALALARMSSEAAPSVPALIRTLIDEDGNVRTAAEYALRRIGEPAVPELIKSKESGSNEIRPAAAAVLDKMREVVQ